MNVHSVSTGSKRFELNVEPADSHGNGTWLGSFQMSGVTIFFYRIRSNERAP